MNRKSRIDPMLSAIEFPGEEEGLIRTWLDSRGFADSVVRESRRLRVVSSRSVLWGSCAVAVLGAGVLSGGSPVLKAAGAPLATFAFVLFGGLVTVSLVGLFGTLHPSWQRDRPEGPGQGQQPSGEPGPGPATMRQTRP